MNRVRVILNPADFIIAPKTRCLIEGFVFAKNQAVANRLRLVLKGQCKKCLR
jgi:hypothetical protein